MKTLSVTLRSILATFVLFALVTLPVNAQVDLKKTGQGTMNFQLVGLSARSAGMGNATYAVSSGAEAIFMNPAGLAEMTKSVDVDLMFTSWIADITYKAGAVAWKMGKYGTLGASALGVDYGTINGTRITAQTVGGPQYEDIGPLTNVNAYSFGLSYAAALNESFSIGGTARYTGQNLGVSLLSSGWVLRNESASLTDQVPFAEVSCPEAAQLSERQTTQHITAMVFNRIRIPTRVRTGSRH